MREKLNRLARGVISGDVPVMTLDRGQISGEVKKGEKLRAEITAGSEGTVPLKGLAYSDHPRVRVLRPSFGGMRNQVVLEADASRLEAGDQIRGFLSLVTNGGERRIPFCFDVLESPAEKTLKSFTDLDSFARVCREEPEAALTIFGYSRFPEAPFMREPALAALYQAFRSGPDRRSALREFMRAAGRGDVFPEEPAGETSEETERDAAGETAGDAAASGVRQEIQGAGDGDGQRAPLSEEARARLSGQRLYSEYLHARIGLWVKEDRDPALLKRVSECLLSMAEAKEKAPDSIPMFTPSGLALLNAEAAMVQGDTERAEALVESVAHEVSRSRGKALFEYLLFETLKARLPGGESRKEGAARLVWKFLEEGGMPYLLPLWLSLKEDETGSGEIAEYLAGQYAAGSRSSFLFGAFARLFEREPERIQVFGDLELHVLGFSLKHGLPGEAAAERYARAATELKSFRPAHLPVLKNLYTRCPTKQLLAAVCTCMIRTDAGDAGDYAWYRRAFDSGIRLTGLYEYLVRSLPESAGEALPHEVFLYFAYDSRLDDRSREKLYENLLSCPAEKQALWGEYREQAETFALQQLMAGRVNRRLAVLYREVLSGDMIDRRLAAVLPGILESERIHTDRPEMRKVVVVYPELKEEDSASLQDGTACVPVYSDSALLLFEDAYGNRYAAGRRSGEKICSMPAVLKRCQEISPESPVFLLRRLPEILLKSEAGRKLTEGEQAVLMVARTDLRLSECFRKRTLSALLKEETEEEFLSTLDFSALDKEDREYYLKQLTARGRFREAYEFFRAALPLSAELSLRKQLVGRAILDQMFPEDPVLLKLSWQLFREGSEDPAVLDYLVSRAGGLTEDLLALMDRASALGVGTSELCERLLAQMLFTGETERLDEVFGRLAESGGAGEMVSRAYITERCARYVLEGREPDPGVFRYLELLFGDRGSSTLPALYGIALTRHYAGLESLTEEQQDMAARILRSLLDGKISFPYYRNLAQLIPGREWFLPPSLLEFRGEPGQSYLLRSRVLPGQESFDEEVLRPVFETVCTAGTELFAGEKWEYEIRSASTGECLQSGVIEGTADGEAGEDGRYGRLNRISAALQKKDEDTVRKETRAYARLSAETSLLFRPAEPEKA